MVDIPPPPMPMIAPPTIPPPAAASIDELIQQSQWNLQQQEQHMHTLRQVQEKRDLPPFFCFQLNVLCGLDLRGESQINYQLMSCSRRTLVVCVLKMN